MSGKAIVGNTDGDDIFPAEVCNKAGEHDSVLNFSHLRTTVIKDKQLLATEIFIPHFMYVFDNSFDPGNLDRVAGGINILFYNGATNTVIAVLSLMEVVEHHEILTDKEVKELHLQSEHEGMKPLR